MDIFEHLSTRGIVPDAEQKAAVCHERGPLLVIAVPGSGKTTVLVSRVARLMALGLAGRENILTVTFNKAAAVDMQRRFDTLFGGIFDRGPRFSTLHSLCWQLLHNAGEPLPIMEEGARMRLIREILRTLSGEHTKVIPEEDILNASNALSYIKNRMIDAADYEGHGLSVSFPRFVEAYRAAMEADGHIDFDDLLLKAYALLDKPEVLEPWQRQFTHILVDEAQDLSLVQHRILQKLAGKASSLFMVGDEDQSIYSFRGAHPESLLDFTKVWPGGQVLRMQTNYRSLPEIVRKADSFIRINKARYPKDMTAHRQGDAQVEPHVFPNKQAQYDFVMSRIAALPEGETSAVLYRTHLSVVPLADRFLREGRPFTSRESGKYFFTHPITQDVRAFLELSLDPTRRDLFEAVYYKFNAFLSRAACAEVMRAPAELNVWQAAEKLARGGDFRASRLRGKLRALAGLARQTPSEALRTLYTDCEYEEYLTRSKALSVSSGAALAQWDALTAMAEGYTTVSGFLDRLDFLEASMPEWEKLSQPGAPVLSTVHGAKGLEFDQVFVLDMAENQFPSANSDMAEEARLFYVAVTRARRILHVGYALPSSPSPFFTRMFPAKAAAPAPLRRPHSPLSKVPKKPKAVDLSLFPVGQGVRHSKFGVGIIEAVDASSGRATVRFAAGIRTLSLADCVEKGVLVPCEFFD